MAQAVSVHASFASAHQSGVVAPSSLGSDQSRTHAQPIDLVHLSRQTLGDRDLEQEILALFRSQSQLYLQRLEHSKTRDERKLAAHTILGSARGIGAWDVAEIVRHVEDDLDHLSHLDGLIEAVERVNDYIGELLD
ncbi:MAG: Hpt domain-containing protein [Pseudomonadota bacterium]